MAHKMSSCAQSSELGAVAYQLSFVAICYQAVHDNLGDPMAQLVRRWFCQRWQTAGGGSNPCWSQVQLAERKRAPTKKKRPCMIICKFSVCADIEQFNHLAKAIKALERKKQQNNQKTEGCFLYLTPLGSRQVV